MLIKWLLAVFALFLLAEAKVTYDGHKVLSVHLEDKQQLELLEKILIATGTLFF
jgi:hypothetical protein